MKPDLLHSIENLCRQAGEFQLSHFRTVKNGDITDKGLNQLVSYVDVETEKLLVSHLADLVPEAGFITEEGTIGQGAVEGLNWIIDPLDGTTNYLHGLGAFSISVALCEGVNPLAGVVYLPVWDEMFAAATNQGATLNGTPIRVSQAESIYQSLLATGFPYTEFEHMDDYLQILSRFMQQSRGLRRMGSAAIDLAYTACGRFDGFFEYGLNAWDVAAGILLVREAGGTVTAFEPSREPVFGKQILASNGKIHEELLRNINS